MPAYFCSAAHDARHFSKTNAPPGSQGAAVIVASGGAIFRTVTGGDREAEKHPFRESANFRTSRTSLLLQHTTVPQTIGQLESMHFPESHYQQGFRKLNRIHLFDWLFENRGVTPSRCQTSMPSIVSVC